MKRCTGRSTQIWEIITSWVKAKLKFRILKSKEKDTGQIDRNPNKTDSRETTKFRVNGFQSRAKIKNILSLLSKIRMD
jgi:hypothetical protein